MWDNYIQKWVAGPQMLDLFLTDSRYLRLDTGGTVRGDIICNTSVVVGEILSSKTLEVQENIAAATGTLGSLIAPFKGTDNNDIVTVGKLFDELANYSPGGATGDFLPLTGGTLTGPLNLQKDLFFDSTTSNANVNVIGTGSDLTFFQGSDAANTDPIFAIGRNEHNAFSHRITNIGNALYDTDALNKRTGAKLFLEKTGGEMTGDIVLKDCGFRQLNDTASLSAQGSLSATRLFTKQNSGWSSTEVLNYSSLKNEFVQRSNPTYTGNITAETSNTQYKAPGGLTFFDENGSILRLQGGFTTFYKKLSLDGNRITDVAEPTNSSDAATKKYVDENGGGGGGFTAHLGSTSGMERGSICLNDSHVLSVVI